MSEKKWTDAQLDCIQKHGGTLLVSAAAGSGKTSVLVERIINRITHPEHPIDVDRLLVVTFTRTAAAEMKNRLAKKLAECLQSDPQNPNLLRQQLLLPRANISTIDSFCGELVRQNFHKLDLPSQFSPGTDEQLSLLKQEALTETIEEFYAANDEGFCELAANVNTGDNDKFLGDVIEEMESFLRSLPDKEQWLSEQLATYDNVTAVNHSVWGRWCLENAVKQLRNAYTLSKMTIDLALQDPQLEKNYKPALLDDKAFIESALEACELGTWDDACEILNSYKATRLKTSAKADPVLKAQVTALRNRVKAILASQAGILCADEETCLSDIAFTKRTLQSLYKAANAFTDRYFEKKKEARLFSFKDIAMQAFKLLVKGFDENGKAIPTDVARELSEQFDEILVDEYQDTDAVQDALFSALSRDESNLFFVGDVKQSIYAFRQALPQNFLRRRDAYPLLKDDQYPATILLANNFRSRREVTEAANYAFYQLMSREVGGLTYDKDEELVFTAPAYRDDAPDGYETEALITELADEDGVKLDANEADARTIAARIKELVGTLDVKDDKGVHKLKYSECCILLRARSATYREVLEQYGIPVVTDNTTPFFETAEIRLALSLLRCIDNPLLDVALTAWLLSPMRGFTPDDLAKIVKGGKHSSLYTALLAARRSDDKKLAERCTAAAEFLEYYRTLACQLTVDKLLLRLYEETALPELMNARSDGERRRLNLQVLLDLCTQFEQNGYRGLTAFIRHIDRLQANGVEIPGAVKTTSEDAVRIMTIHKAKGLEFPVVFVARLHNPFGAHDAKNDMLTHQKYGIGLKRRDGAGNKKHTTLPYRMLLAEASNDEREESIRLLYVAMTRAREKLFLTMAFSDPQDVLISCASWLDDSVGINPLHVTGASSMGAWVLAAFLRHPDANEWRKLIGRDDLPIKLLNNVPMKMLLCTPPAIKDGEGDSSVEPAKPDEALVQEIKERMAYRYPYENLAKVPTKIAASGMSHSTVERRFVAEAQPSFRRKAGMTAAERGTAMHTFMQYADFEAGARDLPREIERLASGGYLTEQQAEVLNRDKLTAFFQSDLYARMARSPRCLREYPFTSLLPASCMDTSLTDDESLMVQGITDCVFEEDGALVIVDYKTDRVTEGQELVERYHAQLETYRHALEQALDMPVRECLLYSFALDAVVEIPL